MLETSRRSFLKNAASLGAGASGLQPETMQAITNLATIGVSPESVLRTLGLKGLRDVAANMLRQYTDMDFWGSNITRFDDSDHSEFNYYLHHRAAAMNDHAMLSLLPGDIRAAVFDTENGELMQHVYDLCSNMSGAEVSETARLCGLTRTASGGLTLADLTLKMRWSALYQTLDLTSDIEGLLNNLPRSRGFVPDADTLDMLAHVDHLIRYGLTVPGRAIPAHYADMLSELAQAPFCQPRDSTAFKAFEATLRTMQNRMLDVFKGECYAEWQIGADTAFKIPWQSADQGVADLEKRLQARMDYMRQRVEKEKAKASSLKCDDARIEIWPGSAPALTGTAADGFLQADAMSEGMSVVRIAWPSDKKARDLAQKMCHEIFGHDAQIISDDGRAGITLLMPHFGSRRDGWDDLHELTRTRDAFAKAIRDHKVDILNLMGIRYFAFTGIPAQIQKTGIGALNFSQY